MSREIKPAMQINRKKNIRFAWRILYRYSLRPLISQKSLFILSKVRAILKEKMKNNRAAKRAFKLEELSNKHDQRMQPCPGQYKGTPSFAIFKLFHVIICRKYCMPGEK